MMYNRWAKLVKDFYKPKKGTFDTTKVPDLYDNALYDMVHNRHLALGSLPEVHATLRRARHYVLLTTYYLLLTTNCVRTVSHAGVRRGAHARLVRRPAGVRRRRAGQGGDRRQDRLRHALQAQARP